MGNYIYPRNEVLGGQFKQAFGCSLEDYWSDLTGFMFTKFCEDMVGLDETNMHFAYEALSNKFGHNSLMVLVELVAYDLHCFVESRKEALDEGCA